MSKIKMPEPVTYAHFTEEGVIRMWSRNPDNLQAVTEAIGKQPTALITTTQAEAYADARVREALEQAAKQCEGRYQPWGNLADDRAADCMSRAAGRIRALIPPQQ